MSIESTGLVPNSAQVSPRVASDTRPRETTLGDDDAPLATPGKDRFEPSTSARRASVHGRFKELANEAFEHPADKSRIARDLKHRFRAALHALKKAGVLDTSQIKSLRKAFKTALKAIDAGPAPAAVTSESSALQSRSFTLDITTAEGDAVKIQLQRQEQASESFSVESSADGLTGRLQQTFSSESVLTFSVEGDLNDEERAAIADLVTRVDQLAERFFDGDVQAALEQAQAFGLPGDEIDAFSVELGYSLESSRVITAYREVAALADPADAPDPSAALDLLDDVRALADSTRLELLFSESRSLVFEFFRSAVESVVAIGAGSTPPTPPTVLDRASSGL